MSRSWFLASLALLSAAIQGSAGAAAAWVPTRTQEHQFSTAAPGPALRPGDTVEIAVSLLMRNKPRMDALTAALTSGKTTRHLTSAEFMSHHAPTPAQVEAVVAHLRTAGFTGIEVAENRMLVSASGTAAAVRAAFDTTLVHVTVDGRDAYANQQAARVPASLAGIVNAVHGLQTVDVARTFHRAMAEPQFGKRDRQFHTAAEYSTIYGADALPPATGTIVAIISQGDITPSLFDLNTFADESGYPRPLVRRIDTGRPNPDRANSIEWNIDSQAALGAAGGQVARMDFYVAPTLEDRHLLAAYNAAVADNTARTINVSLGQCELAARQSGAQAAEDAIFEIAVAQGQVFTVATGDSGSYICNDSKFAGGAYPATSPYVIAVGGTSLATIDQTQYEGEAVWACLGRLRCIVGGGAGGGFSKTEAAPAWQLSSGVLGDSTQRGIPDIAYPADPFSGMWVTTADRQQVLGGTSLSAPLFAGFWARIQSNHANALPFPAASIYAAAAQGQASFMHDVLGGTNGGYRAAPGWDAASGFGSLDIDKLDAFIAAGQR